MLIPGNPSIIRTIAQPSSFSEFSLTYQLNVQLSCYEGVLIPLHNQLLLDHVLLVHRKIKDKYNKSKQLEFEPSYSRILIQNDTDQEWYYWGSSYYKDSIFLGDKMAEERWPDNHEVESLHDWLYYSGYIYPKNMVVMNVSNSERARIDYHSVTIDYFPKEIITKQLFIFSPGTKFVDLQKVKREEFGGGILFNGKYPYAVPINNPDIKKIQFPISIKGINYYLDQQSRLHLIINRDYECKRIEVAAGDTKDTGEFNKDGHIGTIGGSKIKVQLSFKNGKVITIAENLNVPPNGVLKIAASNLLKVYKGDEFIISAQHDPSYIMGVRIQ